MGNKLKKVLSLLLVLVMCISLVPVSAWAEETEDDTEPTETVEQLPEEKTEETQEVEPTIEEETEPVIIPVESITISAEKTELEVGETLQLTATVLPEDATNKEVIWSSSDETVLTVDECGLVTATGAGNANVSVCADSGYALIVLSIIETQNTEDNNGNLLLATNDIGIEIIVDSGM